MPAAPGCGVAMTLDDHAPVPVHALRRIVDAGFSNSITDLGSLVAVPGIAWEAFDQVELERSADAVAALLKGSGVDEVRIVRACDAEGTPGGPAVLARKPAAPGYPTALLYAHHDVQPPGDPLLWDTPAFAAIERDGRLFGRGVADDKAGIIIHLAAFRALGNVLDSFGLGVTFLIEGEEEAGSPTLHTLLEDHADLLRADVIVVADSGNWKVGAGADHQPARTD